MDSRAWRRMLFQWHPIRRKNSKCNIAFVFEFTALQPCLCLLVFGCTCQSSCLATGEMIDFVRDSGCLLIVLHVDILCLNRHRMSTSRIISMQLVVPHFINVITCGYSCKLLMCAKLVF